MLRHTSATLRRTAPALLLAAAAACASPETRAPLDGSEPPFGTPAESVAPPPAATDDGRAATAAPAVLASLPPREWRLAWGKSDRQVGMREPAPEHLAEGPSAVALSPEGDVLVLDRLNERVLRLDAASERVTAVASFPEHVEDVAAAPDGAIAGYSPLRSRVWVTDDRGAAGEIEVPRTLRDIRTIEVGLSRRVSVQSALQETRELGSPSAPLDFGGILRSKREGAAFLRDGRGIEALRTSNGAAALVVLPVPERDDADRSRATRHRHVGSPWIVAPEVASVRVIGTAHAAVACVRLERFAEPGALADPTVVVDREVLCLDVDAREVVLRQPLPRPGLYVPHRELAVGGSPPSVAFLLPEKDGIRVLRWPIPERPGGSRAKAPRGTRGGEAR